MRLMLLSYAMCLARNFTLLMHYPVHHSSHLETLRPSTSSILFVLPCQPAQTTCSSIVLHSSQTQFVQTSFKLCQNGWPKHKRQVTEKLRPYGELTLNNDFLLHGHCIVVPQSLQKRPCRDPQWTSGDH